MTKEEQIKECQTPKLRYIQDSEDAERRLARGERQVFCKICKRWHWRDDLCEIAEVEE